jgi:hypothetical protein
MSVAVGGWASGFVARYWDWEEAGLVVVEGVVGIRFYRTAAGVATMLLGVR